MIIDFHSIFPAKRAASSGGVRRAGRRPSHGSVDALIVLRPDSLCPAAEPCEFDSGGCWRDQDEGGRDQVLTGAGRQPSHGPVDGLMWRPLPTAHQHNGLSG